MTKSTTNYDLFKTIKGNRFIRQKHVAALKKSIEQHDLLEHYPILVNGKFEIIDGQHRLEAAKLLNKPIYYNEAAGVGRDDVMLINNNAQVWFINDYIDSFVSLGKRDYILLKEFCENYDLTNSVGAGLLSGTGPSGRTAANSDLKRGNFIITNLKESEELMKKVWPLRPYIQTNAWRDYKFMNVLVGVLDKADIQTVKEKLADYGRILRRQANVLDYYQWFSNALEIELP